MAGGLSVAQPGPSGQVLPKAAGRLSPLREDLSLIPGPASADGAPTWTLHDAAANRFFRIGWLEMEMLQRWELGTPRAIAAAIGAQTPLKPTPEDVERFAKFLTTGNLLNIPPAERTKALLGQVRARRMSPFMWLLKNYLFVRIPLVRPDRLLGAMQPWIGWIYTRAFLAAVLLAAALGLYLVTRQWGQFTHGFSYLFTPEGMLVAGLALLLAKVVHEFGHGLTAKRFGARVSTMGVAFMVLWPVLYTDTTDAWKLRSRRQRLAIGAAGMAAELGLAVLATLLWVILPDGALRSAVFVLATSTWVMTLVVNLNPFMRFDGYMLLSDFWDMPNLQDRSFALARWRIREALFGFGDAPPELLPDAKRRRLVIYAVATWIYRFFLFLGIALLVYHLFFKLLGLFLFVVEIWWFILRPVFAELKVWASRRSEVTMNRRTALVAALGLSALIALFVPWRTHVTAPAMLQGAAEAVLYAPAPARVDTVGIAVGDRVAEGQGVLTLTSPDLDWQADRAARTVTGLQAQLSGQGTQQALAQRNPVLWSELQQAAAALDALRSEIDRLGLDSPIHGRVVELAEGLKPGAWVTPNEPLAVIVDDARHIVVGFVEEAELARIATGAGAMFVPDDPDLPAIDLTLDSVADTAARDLDLPDLASIHGGRIAVRQMPEGGLVPEQAIYRVRLSPQSPPDLPGRTLRGRIFIEAARESIAARLWRNIVGVLIRESGF